MSSQEDLLGAALDSYHRGKTIPIANSGANGILFDNELQAKISLQVPLSDRLLMRKCSIARARSLIAARRGQLLIAQQAIDESLATQSISSLSSEAKLVTESFHESAAAYLDYRKKQFESAKARIKRAMSIDIYLENRFRYDVLALHRVQLVHNLVRIERQCGNYENAFRYGSGLLKFLEGEAPSWPLPEFTGSGIKDSMQRLAAIMFVQILGELSVILTKSCSEQVNLFSLISKHSKQKNGPPCNMFPSPHEWIYVKEAYVENDTPSFLSRVSVFLDQGPKAIPLLWWTAVLDLFEVSKQIDNQIAVIFQKEVRQDIAKVDSLPYDITARFGG